MYEIAPQSAPIRPVLPLSRDGSRCKAVFTVEGVGPAA